MKRSEAGGRSRFRGCLVTLAVALLLAALAALVGYRLLQARLVVEAPPLEEMEPLGELVERAFPDQPPPPEPPTPIRERRPAPTEQVERYAARRPKSVIELQQRREEQTIDLPTTTGGGRISLIDLNPLVHSWFLLRSERPGEPIRHYHLENADPAGQVVRLDPAFPSGLVLSTTEGEQACDLWSTEPSSLTLASQQRSPYVPLCKRRLFLRNKVQGRRTALEWTTDFLRDNVAGGEKITVFVRQTIYKDAYLVSSDVVRVGGAGLAGTEHRRAPGAPPRAAIDESGETIYVNPQELGLSVVRPVASERLAVGRWYPLVGLDGIYLSALEPRLVAPDLVERQRGRTNPLDEVELSALVYVVAFSLDAYDVSFAVGTDHPRVDWSERVPERVRDASLPGPDGFSSIEPLVATGMVPPYHAPRTVATFTGGFKRSHGAFRSSPLSLVNSGSHYGFAEAGTVLSKLQPGLATFLLYVDGTVELKTWTEDDAGELDRVVAARQNGLPLIEPDGETGEPRVGTLVPRWADGNWSGSVDQRLRTLRAAICSVGAEQRYLLYAYFSTATPSAMARVLAAYHCDYAMLTDMNALEHTYLAVYRGERSELEVEHLIRGMHVLDKEEGELVAPRFLTFPDNRDFFYVVRRRER